MITIGEVGTVLDDKAVGRVRLAGIAGIVASVAWLAGDILLLGKPEVAAAQHSVLSGYDGMTGASLAAMLPASTARLAWGALLGVLTGPLYLLACWHLYQGLRPAGRLLARPPFLLLISGFAIAPFVHGSFFYWGQAVKAVDASGSRSAALADLPGDMADVLFIAYGALMVCWVLGSVWMAVCVLRGGATLPRWAWFVNPLVCLPVGGLVAMAAPGTALQGAQLSIGNLLLFTLSTVVLWKARPEAGAERPPAAAPDADGAAGRETSPA
ncbi:DUF6796 family protein [Streptomyces sp. NPDC057697]|uniref:DUF6796 family protein n=1 Tax=Streptomyces sp. NPDC057697 TaxID=3346219 RepID=UPI0036D186F6